MVTINYITSPFLLKPVVVAKMKGRISSIMFYMYANIEIGISKSCFQNCKTDYRIAFVKVWQTGLLSVNPVLRYINT